MVQVVTNENIQQLIQTRQVPEFKAPEAPKAADATVAGGLASEPSKEGSAPAPDAPARGLDGKFVKADDAQAAKPEGEQAPKAAESDDEHDDDGAKLSDAVKRKIDKIVAKKHRAMKEAEEFGRDEARRAIAAEARADALQRQIDDLKSTKSGEGPAPAKGDDEPKPEDFKTVGEYTRALTKWEVAQARKADQAQSNADKQRQAIQTAQANFGSRVAEAAKAIPDYNEVIESADWDVPHHMQAYIVDSEMGPQIGYHFAKNRDEFDRIAALSPIRAFAELGKLEDKLKAKAAPAPSATAPATTQVSRAPAPIQPLEGKSTTVTKDPSQMNFQELRAHRQAERAAGKSR